MPFVYPFTIGLNAFQSLRAESWIIYLSFDCIWMHCNPFDWIRVDTRIVLINHWNYVFERESHRIDNCLPVDILWPNAVRDQTVLNNYRRQTSVEKEKYILCNKGFDSAVFGPINMSQELRITARIPFRIALIMQRSGAQLSYQA